jgi:hypothetical protein
MNRPGHYVAIKGKAYTVVPLRVHEGEPPAFRMYNEEDCCCYDIEDHPDGPTCDCGDFEYRRINTGTPCKHILACVNLGLIAPPKPRKVSRA